MCGNKCSSQWARSWVVWKPKFGGDRSAKKAGCFEAVNGDEAGGYRLYWSCFVVVLKPDGARRLRLCIAAWNNGDHVLLIAAPATKRTSIGILLVIFISERLNVQDRYMMKIFVKSKMVLRKAICTQGLKEMGSGWEELRWSHVLITEYWSLPSIGLIPTRIFIKNYLP